MPTCLYAQAPPPSTSPPSGPPSQIPPVQTPADLPATVAGSSEEIPDITVSSSRVPAVPAALDRIEVYDDAFIERSDVFTADALLHKLPPSLPGTGQTVLIDGHKSTMDPATIPAEMIDRVEVNEDGTMPDGEHVAGNVVNIILKKNYSGANLNVRDSYPTAGGGSSLELVFNAASLENGLGSSITVSHRATDGLTGAERAFSSDQDHTTEGGRDFEQPWGYPAVVQAESGNLNGVVATNGEPVATALVPAIVSPNGSLTASDFIPGPAGVTDATGLRHFNTAADLYLQTPSVTDGLNLSFSHALGDSVRLETRYGISHSDSQNLMPPPVTPVSSASLVPAAYNPFGQPVEVGMVNLGFGAIRQSGSATTQNAEFSLSNLATTRWEWNARVTLGHSASDQQNPQLDPTLFAAALASPVAALRFDPFTSDAPGTHNASLYPALTDMDESHATTQQLGVAVETHGKLGELWAGPVRLALATEYAINENAQDSTGANVAGSNLRSDAAHASGNIDWPLFSLHKANSPATLVLHGDVTQVTQHSESTLAAEPPVTPVVASSMNSTLRIPWVTPTSSHPGLYRLETDVSVGRAASTTSAPASTQDEVLLWMPIKSVTLRVSDATQQIAPPTTVAPLSISYDQTLVDPLRNIPIATGVEVVSGAPAGLLASLNHERNISLDLTPATAQGLRAGLHYTEQELRGPIRNLSAQDVIDNEAVLPGDVTRAPPSAEDLAIGQPGPITIVNVTPFNGGAVHTRALDYVVHYVATTAPFNTLAVDARARHLLESDNELLPGVPIVSSSDQNSPPDWTYAGEINWKHGTWNFDTEYSRTGSGHYGLLPYAAYASVNMRVSYRFAPLGKGWAKGPQIGLGIANVFDADPPYVDTLTGFRGGSPLGRTAELTLRVPLS